MFLKNYIAKYPDTYLGQPGRFQVPCFHFVAYLPFSSSKKQSEVDVRLWTYFLQLDYCQQSLKCKFQKFVFLIRDSTPVECCTAWTRWEKVHFTTATSTAPRSRSLLTSKFIYLLIWLAERVCCLILLLLQISRYIYPISLAEQDFFTNLGFTHPDLFQVLPCHFNTQSSIQVNNVKSPTKKAFIIILYFMIKLNFIIFEFIF